MRRVLDEAKFGTTITILWHGFEPLMAGKNFYRCVLADCQADPNGRRRIRHCIQTNLLAIDDEWIDLLEKLLDNWAIGTSADPLPGARLMPDGSEAWPKFVENVNLLASRGIAPSVLYVVHKEALPHARSLYWIFRNLGVKGLRFNPVYPAGRCTTGTGSRFQITPQEWKSFIDDLLQIYEEEGTDFPLEPCNEWDGILRSEGDEHAAGVPCSISSDCGTNILGIDEHGDVFPCGRMADSHCLHLGNMADLSLKRLLLMLRETGIADRRKNLKEGSCKGCPSWKFCRGGCADDGRLGSGRWSDRTLWCGANRELSSAASFIKYSTLESK